MQKGRGDVAVKDLRERLARAPDLPPEPLMSNDGRRSARSDGLSSWSIWRRSLHMDSTGLRIRATWNADLRSPLTESHLPVSRARRVTMAASGLRFFGLCRFRRLGTKHRRLIGRSRR